ncbi:hypothetical protein BDW69DRAFT_138429 [Aspergillus filifer]
MSAIIGQRCRRLDNTVIEGSWRKKKQFKVSAGKVKVLEEEKGKKERKRRVVYGKSRWAWFFAGPGPCQINALKGGAGVVWANRGSSPFVTGTQRLEKKEKKVLLGFSSKASRIPFYFQLRDGSALRRQFVAGSCQRMQVRLPHEGRLLRDTGTAESEPSLVSGPEWRTLGK